MMPDFDFQMSLLRLHTATAERGHVFPTAETAPEPDPATEEIAVLAVLARDAGPGPSRA